MPKLDGLEAVIGFLKGLQPKQSNQIAIKAMSLAKDPLPADSSVLKGYDDLRRVDVGEYRIVYRYVASDDVVEIVLVDKRNDDTVYKKLSRMNL